MKMLKKFGYAILKSVQVTANWLSYSLGRTFVFIFILSFGIRLNSLMKIPPGYVVPKTSWELKTHLCWDVSCMEKAWLASYLGTRLRQVLFSRILANCSFVLGVLLVACTQSIESPISQELAPLPTETEIPPIEILTLSPTLPSNTANPTAVVFTKSGQNLGDSRTFSVVIADIDRDSDTDIFTANYSGPSKLWLNDGNGIFSDSGQKFNTSGVHDVGISDLNGDAYLDIFLVSQATPSKVYFNNGSGVFTDSGQNIGSASDSPITIKLGDIDSDDDIDAIIAYYQSPVQLWLNDGNGFFTITGTKYGGSNVSDIELADFNGDAFQDLFLCFSDQPDEVWLNDGTGIFRNSDQKLGSEAGFEHVDVDDVDGDGDNDVVVANSVDGVKVWLNQDNTGSFLETGPYFESGARRANFCDVNGDGDLDLITAHIDNGNKLWINDGSESFSSLGPIFGTSRVLSIACGKLDGDDDFDVVLGKMEGSGGNTIYFNE